jgi:hypothetical protein
LEPAYEPALLAAEKAREKQSAALSAAGKHSSLTQGVMKRLKRNSSACRSLSRIKTSLFCWISYRPRAKAVEASGRAAEAADLLHNAEELLQQHGVRR